jgi:NAD(P)H-binding
VYTLKDILLLLLLSASKPFLNVKVISGSSSTIRIRLTNGWIDATGTVGSEVVKQLSSASTDVNIKAAVHSAENVKKVVKSDKVEPIQIDYNKPETLK